ncbi:MAG TPA: hypothetical protein PK604_12885 [Acetivibrio clariflavus]|nr:hypothetical protein [Acetivibrio clariflavus]
MEDKIEKGRKILLVLIGIMLGIDGIYLLLDLVTFNFGSILTGLVRLTLSIVLYYYLYKGYGVAKVITVILLIISIVLGLVTISLTEDMLQNVIMAGICVYYVIWLLIITFSSSVKAHWQNERDYRGKGA